MNNCQSLLHLLVTQPKCELGVPALQEFYRLLFQSSVLGPVRIPGVGVTRSQSPLPLNFWFSVCLAASFVQCLFSLFCVSEPWQQSWSFLNFCLEKKKNISHKTFTCIVDLTEVGEKEVRTSFYILGIKGISNWKSDVLYLKVTLGLGIWALTPQSAPVHTSFA